MRIVPWCLGLQLNTINEPNAGTPTHYPVPGERLLAERVPPPRDGMLLKATPRYRPLNLLRLPFPRLQQEMNAARYGLVAAEEQ